MRFPEFHYRWEWQLRSNPEALWPLVTDTNRFNRDIGVPDVERRDDSSTTPRRRLRLTRLGVSVEWEEEPFEWIRPSRFGVVRRYLSGPVGVMRVLVELTPRATDGCLLVYQVWAQPRTWLGLVAVPAQIGVLSARRIDRTIRSYDRAAASPVPSQALPARVRFAPGGRARLAVLRDALITGGIHPDLVPRLIKTIEESDELVLSEFRPYALADDWGVPRRSVLELCLAATRIGLLEFRWKILCPLCRGSRGGLTSLADLRTRTHCESCNIDFTANFDRFVELTFRPSPAVREINANEFCVGGPQITPHIVAQQLLPPGAERVLTIPLEVGRYRVRAVALPGGLLLSVSAQGTPSATIRAHPDGWPDDDLDVSTRPVVQFENATAIEQVLVLERLVWTDQAATAAEVIALQLFRDLFATEALRPVEECSVGSVAIVFTDLRSSTELYREIGDAAAFGRVLSHFDVLKEAVAMEGGAVVKTIGDAMMAVFPRPVSALRAVLDAQARLAQPPDGTRSLSVKVGLHYGPCIAVTLNDRLDYFGSTINIAARMEGQSSGHDVVISASVRSDPEVSTWLVGRGGEILVEPVEATLKGFDEVRFSLWRVTREMTRQSVASPPPLSSTVHD